MLTQCLALFSSVILINTSTRHILHVLCFVCFACLCVCVVALLRCCCVVVALLLRCCCVVAFWSCALCGVLCVFRSEKELGALSAGLEPTTYRLTAGRATDCAMKARCHPITNKQHNNTTTQPHQQRTTTENRHANQRTTTNQSRDYVYCSV